MLGQIPCSLLSQWLTYNVNRYLVSLADPRVARAIPAERILRKCILPEDVYKDMKKKRRGAACGGETAGFSHRGKKRKKNFFIKKIGLN